MEMNPGDLRGGSRVPALPGGPALVDVAELAGATFWLSSLARSAPVSLGKGLLDLGGTLGSFFLLPGARRDPGSIFVAHRSSRAAGPVSVGGGMRSRERKHVLYCFLLSNAYLIVRRG